MNLVVFYYSIESYHMFCLKSSIFLLKYILSLRFSSISTKLELVEEAPMNRIRDLRKEHELSQQELAKQLGVNQTAVSQWERGVTTPSSTVMVDLCKLWNVTPDFLLGLSDEKIASTLEDVDAKELQLLKDLVDQLTPDQQQELLRYGRYLASQPPFSKEG